MTYQSKQRFRVRKAEDGYPRSVICEYSNGKGETRETYFPAPAPSIRHADYEYIKHRWPNVRHWKQEQFIKDEYEIQIKPYLERKDEDMEMDSILTPQWLRDIERRQDIEEAIEKIRPAGQGIPAAWVKELTEIKGREALREASRFVEFLRDHPHAAQETLRLMEEIGNRESKIMVPGTIKSRAEDLMDVYTGRVNP
jgi:hypothetical protein